jgi:hypothetical protein
MKAFNFNGIKEDQNIEKIIIERRHKLARQQLIFTLMLALVIIVFAVYITRKIIYTEFDGYVRSEYTDFKALDDLFLLEQYRHVGDVVYPGDTLYSYIYISAITGPIDLNSEPNYIASNRNYRMQSQIAKEDAQVLKVRITELQKQIAREDHNIQFGLSDNSHKMDLQRQLAEAREQYKAALNKVLVYNNMDIETNQKKEDAGYGKEYWNVPGRYEVTSKRRNLYATHYAVAGDTAMVTDLKAMPFIPVMKGEKIIQLQPMALERSHMRIMAYVPTSDMSSIYEHTEADIIVNSQVSFKAEVKMLGAKTEDLPEELRNSLSRTYTTLLVVFVPKRGQTFPLWSAVDRVPVKIRINNFENKKRNNKTDQWELKNERLTPQSIKELEKRKVQNNESQ